VPQNADNTPELSEVVLAFGDYGVLLHVGEYVGVVAAAVGDDDVGGIDHVVETGVDFAPPPVGVRVGDLVAFLKNLLFFYLE
jgi:hypothetical protein